MPRETKTYVQTKVYTRIFTVTLFIIAKKFKQIKYPQTDNETWYIHTTEKYPSPNPPCRATFPPPGRGAPMLNLAGSNV